MTPQIRTRPVTAIVLSVGALLSLVVASLAGSQLEKLLGSQAAATVFSVLALAVIAGVVAGAADLGKNDEKKAAVENVGQASETASKN